MAEYIERRTAIEHLNVWRGGCGSAVECILAEPAADVAPVVHGRWEMRPTGMATDTGPEYKAYCTACNEPNKQYHPPFCPNCGAKMDGGGSDAAD